MEVKKNLKKQIILEIIVLVLLVFAIIYSLFAIKKNHDNKVYSTDGMVVILDDTKFEGINVSSDGMGLESNGVTYTITNNNSEQVKYKIVITPNIHDENVLDNLKVSLDDTKVYYLKDLERDNAGYVIGTNILNPGFTKIHLIKYWYKYDTDKKLVKDNIKFDYKIVKEELINK